MSHQRLIKLFILTLLISFNPITNYHQTANAQPAFEEGTFSYNFGISAGKSSTNNYTIVSLGIGYSLLTGLEFGVNAQQWFSDRTDITKISPQVKYVYTEIPGFKPYIGTFYQFVFIEDHDNEDIFGLRMGAFLSDNGGVAMGVGMVYEEYVNCNGLIDCSSVRPEFLVSIHF